MYILVIVVVLQKWDKEKEKKESLASKCRDVDALLPSLMGVSKSILESVIFCHQDEANWPMMDPAELKSRFDGIFESTRYTKALTAIASKKKELTESFKEMKRAIEVQEKDVERSMELRQQLEASKTKYDEIQQRRRMQTEEVRAMEEEIIELTAQIDSISELQHEVATKQSLMESQG
jgi:DNA repair protein RAD50